jgi:hypothetical protein
LLGNIVVNSPPEQQKMVFPMGFLPRGYKRAQSEGVMEYRIVVGRELGQVLEMAVKGD